MTRRPTVTQAEVSRAIRAMQALGLPIAGVRLEGGAVDNLNLPSAGAGSARPGGRLGAERLGVRDRQELTPIRSTKLPCLFAVPDPMTLVDDAAR